MSPRTLEHEHAPVRPVPDEWLGEHTGAWVDAGLITPTQAAALREFEAQLPVTGEAAQRLGPIAEAGAFVGTLLALIGGGVGLGPQWGNISLALRLAIAAAIAIVGFAGGRWLMRLDEPSTRRLGGFLWVLGTGGLALAAGTLTNEVRRDSPWIAVAVGATVALAGGALWRNRERPFQLMTLGIGLSVATGGVLALVDLNPWHAAAPTALVGVAAWLASGRHALHPEPLARAMASASIISGAFMLCDLSVRWGAAIALVAAAVLLAVALRLGESLALAVGAVGSLMAVQTLVQTTFHGPAGGAIVALVGLAMVTLVVVRAIRLRAAPG